MAYNTYIYIQTDSWVVTVGDDILGLSDQKICIYMCLVLNYSRVIVTWGSEYKGKKKWKSME